MADHAALPWLLPLLRCPWCMSALHPIANPTDPASSESQAPASAGQGQPVSPVVRLEAQVATLRCAGCARLYPVRALGDAETPVPRLKRDDRLATLAHDIVVGRIDPDSLPLARRRFVWRANRRERFLNELLGRVSDPYDLLAERAQPRRGEPTPAAATAFDRFTLRLAPGGTVLDLACGQGAWVLRLAGRGLRVIGADGSAASLAVATGEAARQGTALVGFAEIELMELPFAAASLDGVWCSEAFAYVRPDRRAVFFRQVHRVLRSGGLLYLSAETKPPARLLRRYLLWRAVLGEPVVFGEYIYQMPRTLGGGWHYQAMSTARALSALCHDHGLRVLSLRRDGALWLLLAEKK